MSSSKSGNIAFPILFTTTPVVVSVNMRTDNSSLYYSQIARAKNNQYFTIPSSSQCDWFAIGFQNGLKVQWGIETSNNSGEATISFDVIFSNNRYSVVVTSNYQNDSYATTTNTAKNKTSSSFFVKNYRSTAAAQTTDSVLFSWIAIGY